MLYVITLGIFLGRIIGDNGGVGYGTYYLHELSVYYCAYYPLHYTSYYNRQGDEQSYWSFSVTMSKK
jgi:hypothetical protein